MKLKTAEINAELTLFCPRRTCPMLSQKRQQAKQRRHLYHQERPDSTTDVLLRGWRTSVSGYSELFGKHGSFKKYEQVAKLSCYDLSSRAIADVLDLDQRTVDMWQRCISKKSDKFHRVICTLLTLNLLFLHKDELCLI